MTAPAAADTNPYRRIFHDSPRVRMLVEVSGGKTCRIVALNAVAVYRFSVTDDIGEGKTASQIFNADIAEIFQDAFGACVRDRKPVTIHTLPQLQGGDATLQAFVLNPITDEDGNVIFIDVMSCREPALRQAKAEADSASKAKSVFLANMSHELRTPLNAILGFSDLMRKETFGPLGSGKYIEYLGDIHFSAQHLLSIINDVLDMSKIEAGKLSPVESELTVQEVFDSVGRMISERALRANITIQRDIPKNLPHLRADQRLVRQALLNLVVNAVKFSPEGSTVTMRAALDDGLVLSVSDHGRGIPKDKLEEVLQPFSQAGGPDTSDGQGAGLGLPLARAMVEVHGGTLNIQSEEGRGTVVSLHFPADRLLS